MNQNQFTNVLPEDFDGVFRFTNPSDEDFTGYWDNRAYLFPAKKTTPMFIRNATPEETQNIRKKFARDLAEREYFKSEQYKKMTAVERANNAPAFNSFQQANSFDLTDIQTYIQKCLTPMDEGVLQVTEVPKVNIEERLSKNDEGEVNTTPIDKKMSLKKKALDA